MTTLNCIAGCSVLNRFNGQCCKDCCISTDRKTIYVFYNFRKMCTETYFRYQLPIKIKQK